MDKKLGCVYYFMQSFVMYLLTTTRLYDKHSNVLCIDRNDYDILCQHCLYAQIKHAQQPQSTQRNNARATSRDCKGFHTFLLRDTNQINNAQ